MSNKIKVAVYGNLRKGLKDHDTYLDKSKSLGSFISHPIYTLANFEKSCGLIEGGYTSVKMEVYEIDFATLDNIDLELGYYEKEPELGLYNRKTIVTPYGNAIAYFYNPMTTEAIVPIEIGDWKEYLDIESRRVKA